MLAPKNKESFAKKIINRLKSIDIFGHEIKLLYKGKTSNQTATGGVFTLICSFLIVGYLALEFRKVVSYTSTIT